jgi:predicted ATPase
MYISKIKIENYKGFNNHEVIKLKQGINLIIGKNNSGKTALLEALTFSQIEKPYLSESSNSKTCSVQGQFIFEIKDIMRYLNETNKKYFSFPNVIFPFPYENLEWNDEILENVYSLCYYKEHHLSESEIELEQKYIDIDEFKKLTTSFFDNKLPIKFNRYKNFYGIDLSIYSNFFLSFELNDTKIKYVPEKQQQRNSIEQIIEHNRAKNIYKFDIHRKVEAKFPVSENLTLYNDCRNLASVLDGLQGDRKLFNEFESKFLYIFPDIKEITLQKAKDQNVELKVCNKEPILGRPDLAISLDDCGTGVGQVLSILYVVISSIEPKVILIDEPNSFLHPSASRKLMEVLTEYPQHQYFITTHSPELISNFGDNIMHTQLINGEINVKQIEKKEKEKVETIFSDLGIRLSDVYGYDNIFWVEGETEEKCLPLILKEQKIDISNTIFLSVKDTGGTGKFAKDYINTTVKIYKKVSLIESTYTPTAIGFFFDSEGKDTQKILDEIDEGNRAKVIFTDKMLYENYLMNEEAIFKLLKKIKQEDPTQGANLSMLDLTTWIENNNSKIDFWKTKKGESFDQRAIDNHNQTFVLPNNWKDKIHAANFLAEMFNHFLGKKMIDGKEYDAYRKTKHSIELTKIVLGQNPENFNEFVEKISKIIK